VISGPRSAIVRNPSQPAINSAIIGTAQIQGNPAHGRRLGDGSPPDPEEPVG
jgi:hypothetical protein